MAIVAHATVIQSLICGAQGVPLADRLVEPVRQPYCSWYELGWDGAFHLLGGPYSPAPPLDRELAARLLRASGAPERVRAHCRAVAEVAEELCTELLKAGAAIDTEAVYCAALLHDIARDRPEHPAVAAQWLEKLGYGSCGSLVRQHHELDAPGVDEAGLLFIADKCVIEDKRVSLALRFEQSLERCTSDESRAAHRRRAETALGLQRMINTYCGKKIIA